MGLIYLLAITLCLGARRRICQALALANLRAATLTLGAAGIVGHVLLVTNSMMRGSVTAATLLALLGFSLSITFIVGHILIWQSVLTELPIGQALCAITASNALSYLVQLVGDLVMGRALLAYLMICPIFSAAFSCPALRARGLASPSNVSMIPTPSAFGHLPWKLIVPTVILIYFEQVLTSLLFQRYSDWPRDNLTITLAAGLLIWSAASIYLARHTFGSTEMARREPTHDTVEQAKTGILVLSAGLLLVYMASLLATVLITSEGAPVSERLLVAAGSSFRVVLWILLTCAVKLGKTDAVCACSTYIFFVLALPVSRIAALVFANMSDERLSMLLSPGIIMPAICIILFVMASTIVIFNIRTTRQRPRAFSEKTDGQNVDKQRATDLASLVATAALSAREADVLDLICRGYSARHAGEKLGISESTVVSHITHIYRKLGVSSKQELIALIDQKSAAQIAS